MSADRDLDRITAAWLDLMPDEAPDRVIDAVLHAVERAPQTRRPLARVPWRSSPMFRLALLAGAAVLLGAAIVGGALLGGGRPAATAVPAPPSAAAAVPAVTASPAATTGATPAPTASPNPAPETLRANWLATLPADTPFGALDGPARLIVNASGSAAWLRAPAGNEALRSTPDATAADELVLSLVRDAWGCPTGTAGRYRWTLADDRLHLTLVALEDPCALRARALARTWTRTHDGVSDGGTAVLPGVGPLVQVTLPAGSYTTRPMDKAQEVYDQPRDYVFYAWLNPEAFVDPCSKVEVRPWKAGGAAFIAALRQNPALTGFKTSPLTVGGFPAIRVTFSARSDYPKCTPDHAFYEWRPTGTTGSWWLGAGDKDELYLVDHPDGTLMFQVLPVGDATTADVIGSIRFPGELPAATP